jgi:outer membrane protein assembly factor BamB
LLTLFLPPALALGLSFLCSGEAPVPGGEAAKLRASDWPNWRGPHYDGISRETGLLKTWPADGPKVLWQSAVTGGYSSVAVSHGRLFTQTQEKGEEVILCLDAATGNKLWEFRYACDYDRHASLDQRFKSGPRATPAVDGGQVYTVGTTGLLHCLEAATGKKVWGQDLLKLADRTCPEFGYCNSPFILGDLLYVNPGGQKGNSLAALNKKDGRVVWQALDDLIGYATPIHFEFNGSPQLVYFTGEAVVGVTPAEGKLLWRFPWRTDYDLNVATPIYSDGRVFISSNYGSGAALLRLRAQGDPEVVWTSLVMQNHFSTSVLHEGFLYGFSNERLRCVELARGKAKWDRTGLGRGSVLLADGLMIALGDRGQLVLAEATPTAYVEKARWQALDGVCWSVPVLANGRLYLRNESTLLAVDLLNPK